MPCLRLGRTRLTLLMRLGGGPGGVIVASVLSGCDSAQPDGCGRGADRRRLRLESGLALLTDGKAKKLFISGVNPRVERDVLLRSLGAPAEREACCIVLGKEADNTRATPGRPPAGCMTRATAACAW